MTGVLHTASAPPLLLPGEHFIAAFLFLLCGSVGVVIVAPDLANGLFLSPRVAGVTHLFTLGWITTSIMGALYQFLPVALGKPIASIRLAHLSFILYVPGLAAFVSGLVFAHSAVMLGGAVAFGSGLLIFIGNLATTLARSSRRDVTWWALSCATAFLLVTLFFGVTLAGNLRWGYLAEHRLVALGVHLHVALTGWVLLVMIGVGTRLLPMFLLTHGAKSVFGGVAVSLIAAGAASVVVFHHAAPPLARVLPAILLSAGVGAFLLQAREYYAHRHRPVLDPGMRLAAVALGFLALAAALGWPAVVIGGTGRLATAYITAAILAISLFVAAHYYKIVPFLIWFHHFGPLAGKQKLPRVIDLYSARLALAAASALAAGAIAMVGGVAAGSPAVARAASFLFLCGVSIEAAQMSIISRRKP